MRQRKPFLTKPGVGEQKQPFKYLEILGGGGTRIPSGTEGRRKNIPWATTQFKLDTERNGTQLFSLVHMQPCQFNHY